MRALHPLLIMSVASAAAGGSLSAPSSPHGRMIVVGRQFVSPDGVFVPHGLNWNYAWKPGDASLAKAMGANFIRIRVGYGIDPTHNCSRAIPNGSHDAYRPNSPESGYLDPGQLALLAAEVADVDSAGLYYSIALYGMDCGFDDDSARLAKWRTSILFVDRKYRSDPHFAVLEPRAEPHLTNNDNKIVTANYLNVITAIRAEDQTIPILVGSAPDYQCRNVDEVHISGVQGIAYTCDEYEPKAYVQELHSRPGPYAGYPGTFSDYMRTNFSCQYPNARARRIAVDRNYSQQIINCALKFSFHYNVPFYFQQWGIPTGTPGAARWTADVGALMNASHLGHVLWVQRQPNSIVSLLCSDFGVWWQERDGTWRRKDGSVGSGCPDSTNWYKLYSGILHG